MHKGRSSSNDEKILIIILRNPPFLLLEILIKPADPLNDLISLSFSPLLPVSELKNDWLLTSSCQDSKPRVRKQADMRTWLRRRRRRIALWQNHYPKKMSRVISWQHPSISIEDRGKIISSNLLTGRGGRKKGGMDRRCRPTANGCYLCVITILKQILAAERSPRTLPCIPGSNGVD